MNSQQLVSITLPAELCAQLEARYLGDRFATLQELVEFILQDLVNDEASDPEAREQEIIERRLQELGYI